MCAHKSYDRRGKKRKRGVGNLSEGEKEEEVKKVFKGTGRKGDFSESAEESGR